MEGSAIPELAIETRRSPDSMAKKDPKPTRKFKSLREVNEAHGIEARTDWEGEVVVHIRAPRRKGKGQPKR